MVLPEKADGVVPMTVRNLYHTAEEINAVLQAIEDQKTNCTDYNVNLDSGIADQIPAYEKPIARADTERMQNLLRQFSFFILQSMNPIAGYEYKEGNVKPNFLISALEQEQISKEEMDQYLAEYTVQHEIPDTISQALQSTDSQDNIYSLMLESELQNLIQYLKNSMTRNLTDMAIKTEFIGVTSELQNAPAREQIMAILNWLLQKYSSNKKLISDNIDAITKHKTTTGLLTSSLQNQDAKLLNLESDDQSTKYIDHYHFTVWPDLSVRIITLDLIN
jgi:hypothetical protein